MANASRLLLVKKGGTTIAGMNAKSITNGATSIDITSDEDVGFRTLAAETGLETLDISGSGVTKDFALRQLALTGGARLFTDVTIEYPPVGTQTTGDSISGDFFFSGFTENGGSSDGAIEFDFSMESSGQWTFTPGSVV